MVIYVCTFLLSSFLFLLSAKTKKMFSVLMQGLGIVLPCLVAAFRDETIGTDLTVYGTYVYQGTQHVSLFHAINVYSDNPVGFVTYAWLINLVHGSFQIYLFGIELLIILPTYLCFKYFAQKNTWICMIVYYFIFYGISLNIMKQMIAISLGMLAFRMYYEKQNTKGVLLSISALLFHQTAFVVFLMYPLYEIYKKFANSSWFKKIVFYCTSALCCVLIFACFQRIIGFISVMKESYSFITENEGNGEFMLSPIIYLLFILLLHFFSRYALRKNNETSLGILYNTFFYFEYLSVFGLIFLETQVLTLGVARFGYYFEVFLPLYIGMTFTKKNVLWVKSIAIVMILCVCILQTRSYLNGACDIYPYTSSFLRIYK